MPRWYKSGRTRVIHSRNTVTVMASFGLGYTRGFGIREGTLGGFFGFFVPAKPGGGNGFLPIISTTGLALGTVISATIRIDRIVVLEEQFSHDQNGRRRDVYAASGSSEVYSSIYGTFTSRDSSSGFWPGQSPGDWDAFGIVGQSNLSDIVAYSSNGYILSTGFPAPNIGVSSGDMTITWDWRIVDPSDPSGPGLFPTPDAPGHSSTAGTSAWGNITASGPAAPPNGLIDQYAGKRRSIGVNLMHFPRHAFAVEMCPIALPRGDRFRAPHRLEVSQRDPTGGSSLPYAMNLNSEGETINIACGGTLWKVVHQPLRSNPLVSGGWEPDGAGIVSTYRDFLPLVASLRVLDGAYDPYSCHVGAPFNALGLTQAGAVTVPTVAGTTVVVGTPVTKTINERIGYRYIRVKAKTPAGTGSLTIESHLDGALINPTATQALVTTVADTFVTVDFDLLEVPGCTFEPELTLDKLVFTASGADFLIDMCELFVKDERLIQSMSPMRSLAPADDLSEAPWIECYTDGVRSLKQSTAVSYPAGVSINVAVKSLTVRQLVQEINGTTRHSYPGTWSPPFPYGHTLGSAAGTPPPLLGWVATDNAPPSGAKSYGADAIGDWADFKDSDVYLPALHGDGVIARKLLLGWTGDTILPSSVQAQRFASLVEPGQLPGLAGFDGTDPVAFSAEESPVVTPVRFTRIYRGGAQGMQIGPLKALPIEETEQTGGGTTTTFDPPRPVGVTSCRPSGFYLASEPLKGTGNNFKLTENRIKNDGGTDSAALLSPYSRERPYFRFWTDEITFSPVWISSLVHKHTAMFIRASTKDKDLIVVRTSGGVPGDTALRAFSIVATVETGEALGPISMAFTQQEQLKIWFAIESGDGWQIWEARSDDDGDTWYDKTHVYPAAGSYLVANPYPKIATATGDTLGGEIYYWFEKTGVDGSGNDQGKLKGLYVAPGAAFVLASATYFKNQATGADLLVSWGSTDMVQQHSGQCFWVLSCVVPGETDVSEWRCANEALLKFERIV